MKTAITVVVPLVSSAWGQSTSKTNSTAPQSALPTMDDCDKTAFDAAKLVDDLRKTPESEKKAELIHSRGSDAIEKHLATCRMVAMSHADITRVNEYADLQTWLMGEEYYTLRELTKALKAECH
jgi:hypothetical protein